MSNKFGYFVNEFETWQYFSSNYSLAIDSFVTCCQARNTFNVNHFVGYLVHQLDMSLVADKYVDISIEEIDYVFFGSFG